MSIERTLIARSQPYVISSFSKSIIENEAKKGCDSKLFPFPVKLEPFHMNPTNWISNQAIVRSRSYVEDDSPFKLNKRFLCWMPPEHVLEWLKPELMLKLLEGARGRICFEIIGNSKNIDLLFKTTELDEDLFKVAFKGEFQMSEITPYEMDSFYKKNIFFRDYFPHPPYHHLFTTSKELHDSPFEPLITAIANLENESTGFLQVLFEPVRNNWHQNVEMLNDLEYLSKSINDPRSLARIKQQLPSGDIRNMARDVESKAHNDKPFYSVAVRSGIISDECRFDISSLSSFMSLFQHGGRPINYLTPEDYNKILSKEKIQQMFEDCLTYRPGFLLNSNELSGLVHLPSMDIFHEKDVPLNYLENSLTIPDSSSSEDGIKLGQSSYAGEKISVRISRGIRETSTHLIGKSGSGKSTLMENMIIQDIDANEGVAVFDPHGDTVKRLLKLIPEQKVDNTIYIDFGNPEWIPIWNPLKRTPYHDIGRTANDLVSSFQKIVQANTWGHRLEHLLRNGISGLLHLDNSTMYDLLVLFEQSRNASKEKNLLVNKISKLVTNPVAKRFWEKDFKYYKRDDFTPSHNKLSKLLNSEETVSLMLTQSENFIDFETIIENGKILLVDLSNIGSESREVLGSYLLTILHNYSLSRSRLNLNERKPFNVYCDEAHKITTDSLKDMIIESRKFGINYTLAHQFLSQFNISQRDALLSMGTTIIFNTNLIDAQMLSKELKGKVESNEIAQLELGEAIGKIGTEIVKFKTGGPIKLEDNNYSEEILKNCHAKYYRRTDEVKRRIRIKLRELYSMEYEFEEKIQTADPSGSKIEYEEFN